MEYIKAFIVGGLICALVQILMDKTKLLPGRVMVILVILGVQVALVITSKTNSTIHDHMAATVAVDLASQMIFDSPEALMDYKKKVHAEKVKRETY